MRSVVLIILAVCLAFCAPAPAQDDSPVGSQPDPGLRDKAPVDPNGRGKLIPDRPRTPSRAARPDFLDEAIIPLPAAEFHFSAGSTDQTCERLEYDISVDHLPHGKAVMELRSQDKNGKPVWSATMKTRANRTVALFFDVHDTVRSDFDAKGGFSRFFFMDRKEGRSAASERILFNYEKDTMAATYERPRIVGDNQVRWVQSTIPLTTKVLDPLSAVYFLRNPDLNLKNIQPGKKAPSITLPICSDRHVWNTRLLAVGLDHPDVGNLKNRDCIVFDIDAPFQGLFEHVGKVRVWVDVATGVVLKMSAEISIGAAEAVLSEHVNSPLDAK